MDSYPLRRLLATRGKRARVDAQAGAASTSLTRIVGIKFRPTLFSGPCLMPAWLFPHLFVITLRGLNVNFLGLGVCLIL